MIIPLLTTYTHYLAEYLAQRYHRPEGVAELNSISASSNAKPNKIIVSLINIERETAGGISTNVQRTTDGYSQTFPALQLNLSIMLAAIYDEKRYAESLSVLSDTLRFIQSTPKFRVDGTDYTIEIVALSPQETNNIWTLLGGQYYPSVVCKIRRIIINAAEIMSTGNIVSSTVTEI